MNTGLDFDIVKMAREAGVRLPAKSEDLEADDLLRLATFCDQHAEKLVSDQSGLFLMRTKAARLDNIHWFRNSARALRGAADALSKGKWEFHDEPIHTWFELSYAQYLTIPRTVLQSMPDRWQREFVRLLEEMDDAIDWRPEHGTYRVQLCEIVEEFDEDEGRHVSQWGRELDDPLQDYNRGRRKLPLHKKD